MSDAEKKLLETRKVLEARARNDWHGAQEAYEEAAAKHLPTTEKLRRAANKAKARLRRRKHLTEAAQKDLNTPDFPVLNPEVVKISPCKSSRNGVKPRLIVLHITVSHNRPGTADLNAIVDFFGNLSTQASSHIVNDAEGNDARCVPDTYKAWTQAAYNPQSLSIEQIEYADKQRSRWFDENRPQLENTALWVARWSHRYGIPLKHSTSRGVCQHRELGLAGGGHTDVGEGYPFNWVLNRAKQIKKEKYG